MEVSTSFMKEGSYSLYVSSLNDTSTDYIHFDVMDGSFTDSVNLSMKELGELLLLSNKKNDVHLMVSNPKPFIDFLSDYPVYSVAVHAEIPNYLEMISLINSYGFKAGIAINPDTPVFFISDILDKVSYILVMGVVPGKSGQVFDEAVSLKIKELRSLISSRDLDVKISVDGGICMDVLPLVCDADILVSASFILDDFSNIDKIHNFGK